LASIKFKPHHFSISYNIAEKGHLLIGCCFCWQVMLKNLEQVVSMILNGFQHPHPRVRWAAINAIGQLSTDLGPDLQVHYHQKVLPALANAMDDFQNPRVQVSSIISAKLYLTPFNLLLLICCINQLDVDEEVFVRPSY